MGRGLGAALCVAVLTVPAGALGAARKPDLTVRTLNVSPGQIRAGGTLSLLARIVNRGKVPAKKSVLGIYFSRDGKHDAGDTRVARLPVKALGPGASTSASAELTVTTTRKSFEVLACADDTHKVAESREGNNCNPSGLVTITAQSSG